MKVARESAWEEDFDTEYRGTIEEQGEAHVLSLMREGRRIPTPDNWLGPPSASRYIADPLKQLAANRRRDATECFRYIVNMPTGVAETLKSTNDLTKLLEQQVEFKSKGVQFEPAIKTKKARYITLAHFLDGPTGSSRSSLPFLNTQLLILSLARGWQSHIPASR